jgi:AcrR family transcriptional regulator
MEGATPKRMTREARREQLERAAMQAIAAHGADGRLMEEVGESCGVTRNLLYHYFPRGRPDLVLAAARRATGEIVAGWQTDPAVPLAERLSANTTHVLSHALGPSDAWVTVRRTRSSSDPEVRAVVRASIDQIVDTIAANNDAPPTPLVRSAIRGFIAFADTVFDDARGGRLPAEQVGALLQATLAAAIAAARSSS